MLPFDVFDVLKNQASEVDVDETILDMYQNRAVPLILEHLIQREAPLRIEIFKGSIDASVECLRNTDAVIAIEIIEHLYPDILENIPFNIFGFIQPKLAIFSTPNSDYNVLFSPLLENGFRHHDHKFEWSQEQFTDWAQNITERFPNYVVAILGVGEVPADTPDYGPVSQFAVFARKDVLLMPLAAELQDIPSDSTPDIQYKEIYSVDYPLHHDDRSQDQKIFDEATYHINQYRTFERYHNSELQIYQIPIDRILDVVKPLTESVDDLRRILLANGHVLEGNLLILPEDDPDRFERRWSDDSDSNYDFNIYGEEEQVNTPNGNGYAGEGEDFENEAEEERWD